MRLTIDVLQIFAVIAGIVLCIYGSVSWPTFMLIVLFSFHAHIKIVGEGISRLFHLAFLLQWRGLRGQVPDGRGVLACHRIVGRFGRPTGRINNGRGTLVIGKGPIGAVPSRCVGRPVQADTETKPSRIGPRPRPPNAGRESVSVSSRS